MIINERAGAFAGYGAAGDEDEAVFGPPVRASAQDEAPSRSLWFLIGGVTMLLGPSLLDLLKPGSRYATRRIEKA